MSISLLQTFALRLGRIFSLRDQGVGHAVSVAERSWPAQSSADSLSTILPGLSLSARFGFAAAVVLCNGMALLGGWVVTQIERGFLQNAAVSESVYIQSLFTPVVPLLAAREKEPSQLTAAIESSLQSTPLRARLTSIAIWLPDGSIAYSTDKRLIGRKYPMPAEVGEAFGGEVRTTIADRRLKLIYPDSPDAGAAAARTVYTPLHEKEGGSVAAVVEIVTEAEPFKAQLDSIRRRTWIVVGLSTLLMIGLLFGIVHNGSQTIEEQRIEINRRLDEEIRLGKINKELSERLQDANRRGIELGEEQLRRIGSDLENGPVQLLALALLRMYELKPPADGDGGEPAPSHSIADVIDVITQATSGAMRELREISSGLLLPELKRFSAHQAVERAVRAHERSTDTVVERDLSSFPEQLPLPITICIFRVVQEGLLNAYCHAGGRGQAVTGFRENDAAVITVSDDGPGFSPEETLRPGSNLGLRWLRQRVESIGGTLTIESSDETGTRLTARFPYAPPAAPAKDPMG